MPMVDLSYPSAMLRQPVMVHAQFAESDPSIFAKSTGKAVLVSALTTVAGFGSLIMAKHRGIASLGEVMAVGTATCMLAAVTFLPALMKLLMAAGWKAKKPSGDQP